MPSPLVVPKAAPGLGSPAGAGSPSARSPLSPAAAASMSPTPQGPTGCRLCGELGPAHDLVNPCACVGQAKYVHVPCLVEWFEHRRPVEPKWKKKNVFKKQKQPAPPTPAAVGVETMKIACPTCNATYVGAAAVELGKVKLRVSLERHANNRVTAGVASELAEVYKKQGRYQEAVELYKQALDIHEKLNIDNCDSQQANDHNNLGACLRNLGHRHFAEAETHFKQALRMRESLLGPGHVDVATAKHNLATLLQNMHRFDEAMVLAKSAMQVRMSTLGEDNAVAQVSKGLVEHLKKDILRASLDR